MRRPHILAGLRVLLRSIGAAMFPPDVPAPASPAETMPLTSRTTMRIRADAVGSVEEPLESVRAFDPATPMPGVLPAGHKTTNSVAMDAAIQWAGLDTLDEGLAFLGFPYLAQLTQRAEYRRPSEVLAGEMTRKWIRLLATGDEDKTDKLAKIDAELKRLKVQDVFRRAAEQDGFFGRSQIFIDIGAKTNKELTFPLSVDKRKIIQGSLKALTLIEPLWTYPDAYNSDDPTRDDFYKPTSWFVFSKRIHASRLLTFISRPVPDILKPAYAFGGLSLSQIAKPYVDNWLRTRQSVSDAIHNYSVMVLITNMSGILSGGGKAQMLLRAKLFNQARDNAGLMMVDKETEDFKNVSMPLGSLDKLQAQAQEHMAAVTGIPLVVLLGITPTGLNASPDGEIKVFNGYVGAKQETDFRPPLTKVIDIVQLSLFGEIDPAITFLFEPLEVMSDTDKATVEKTKMDTHVAAIGAAIITPQEARVALAADEDSPYAALDTSEEALPEPPVEPGEGGPTDPNDPTGSAGLGGAPTPPAKPVTEHAPLPAPAQKVAPTVAADAAMKAAGIMFRAPDGSVLLLKRGAGGDHGGEWCFPGGKVEEGESRKEAARREAREEIGDHSEGALEEIDRSGDEEDDGGVDFTTFVQKVTAPFVPTLNHEHTAWAWARPDSLPEPMHPGPRDTLAGRTHADAAAEAA